MGLEELKTGKKSDATALLDLGCVWTCVDEAYARNQKWPLQKVPHLIKVQYADGSSTQGLTIQYSVDIRIRVAGAMVVTGTPVTRLKSYLTQAEAVGQVRTMLEWVR
jgi:hypothetical protein